MITHATDSGIVYEVEISQEEVEQRMAALIGKLYPTFLDLCASGRGAEENREVVGISQPKHKNQIASDCTGVRTQPRVRAHKEGAR